MKITTQMLREHNACDIEVCLFKCMFGNEASVTKANCLKAADKLSFSWAAIYLLPRKARTAYNRDEARAVRAYRIAQETAWDKYTKAETEARMAYHLATTTTTEVMSYSAAVKVAKAEYNKAIAPARAEYNKAVALAFWKASKVKQEKPHA